MERADHGKRAGGQRRVGGTLLHHYAQAQSHGGDHSLAQCRRRIVGLLLNQVVDGVLFQAGVFGSAVYEAGEYRHTDLCRRLLWPRLQW